MASISSLKPSLALSLPASVLLVGLATGCGDPKAAHDKGETPSRSDDAGNETTASDAGSDSGAADAGPSAFTGPLYAGGSRLALREVVGEGLRSFVGFFDRELKVDCDFVEVEDGEYRCLPSLDYDVDLDSRYSESKCRGEPTAELPACRGRAPYVTRTSEPAAECDKPKRQVFALGESKPTAGYNQLASQCVATPTLEVQRVGDEVELARFMAATSSVEIASDGLGVRVLRAEDGSVQALGWVDLDLGDCVAGQVRGQGPRCIPGALGRAGVHWFADAECKTQPLAVGDVPACGRSPARFAVAIHAAKGRYEPSEYEVFDQSPEPVSVSYFGSAGAGCAQGAPDPKVALYPITPTKEKLTNMRPVVEGEGRMQVVSFAGSAGALAPRLHESFFDSGLDKPCRIQATVEGDLRCIPELPLAQVEFEDDQCTKPVIVDVEEAKEGALVQLLATACSRLAADVRPLGVLYDGPAYVQEYGECVPTKEEKARYRAGPSHLADFPKLQISHD